MLARSARHLTAATVTAAALVLAGPTVAAQAGTRADHVHVKTDKSNHSKHGKTSKLERDQRHALRAVERKSTALDRAVRAHRVGALADDVRTALLANVAADQLALETLRATVEAAGGSTDLRLVRRDLRSLRPENYVLVVNVLRHAGHVAQAAGDPEHGDAEATALAESAVAKALLVTATSAKSAVREARADLSAAQALLDTEETEATEATEETGTEETEETVEA